MSVPVVRTRWHDAVLEVTISRPERRNALDAAALTGLAAAVREAEDGGARVLVLGGDDGHFCAGADLSTVEDDGFVEALRAVLQSLRAAPFVTIAGVEGAALGAGTQLAVSCDLRTATADASFGIPAAKLGLMVDQWTVQRLVHTVGQGMGRAMLLAAEVVNGADAVRLGLAQREGGVDAALTWAGEIARLAPLTVAGHKIGCNDAEDLDLETEMYSSARAAAWASEDLSEGLAAFRERRRPEFEGR